MVSHGSTLPDIVDNQENLAPSDLETQNKTDIQENNGSHSVSENTLDRVVIDENGLERRFSQQWNMLFGMQGQELCNNISDNNQVEIDMGKVFASGNQDTVQVSSNQPLANILQSRGFISIVGCVAAAILIFGTWFCFRD